MNVETAVYRCHRCGEGGKLGAPGDSPIRPPSKRARLARLEERFRLGSDGVGENDHPIDGGQVGLPLRDASEGLAYLERRAIPATLAIAAGCRYSRTWANGRAALIFPLLGEDGASIAAHGRFVDAGQPKALTRGPKRLALFPTPGALRAPTFAVAEAPFDALALARAGLPSVAIVGTEATHWLRRRVFARRVFVATDADAAGDTAAERLMASCADFGARVDRLRPPDGVKDWNDLLVTTGVQSLRTHLSPHLPSPAVDPRADLEGDSVLWGHLLTHAHAISGDDPAGLHPVLHGLRCVGTRLEVRATTAWLMAGEFASEEYERAREDYLRPYAHTLAWLLAEVASLAEETNPAIPAIPPK